MTRAICDRAVAGEATWDAVIAGAGPAGAFASRQLATAGARVLLADKQAFPRGKVCGECLNGQALAVLADAGLGALVLRLGGIVLDEFVLQLAGRPTRLALPAGAARSRSRFDAALVDAVVAAGARFLPETRANIMAADAEGRRVELVQHGRRATARARVVLAATGLGPPCVAPRGEPVARSEMVRRLELITRRDLSTRSETFGSLGGGFVDLTCLAR